MAKFKVGDRVIAKKNDKYNITNNGWKGVVTFVDSNDDMCVMGPGASGEIGFYVKSKYFDLDMSCNQKIVITSDGRTTLARLYRDNSVVKTAEAKCSPEDEFDFERGAFIAFARLTDSAYILNDDEPQTFKVGDRVKIIGNTNYHPFEIGSIVTIKKFFACQDKPVWKCESTDKNGWYLVRESDMVKIEEFDWKGFKANEIAVKVTKDNFKEFVAEAKKHGCTFYDDEDFNPFNDAFHAMYCILNSDVNRNELYLVYKDGCIKGQHELCDMKEFVW